MKATAFVRLLTVGAAITAANLAIPSSLRGLTVATFADPSGGSLPLFAIDDTNKEITAGWSHQNPSLTLELVFIQNGVVVDRVVCPEAYFTVTDNLGNGLGYTGSMFGGTTEGGRIEFFTLDAGLSPSLLLQITFGSAQLWSGGLGADDIFSGNGVEISGPTITGTVTFDETFSFNFANQTLLRDTQQNIIGYTATASYTSSASIAEPMVIGMLALGIPMVVVRGRGRSRSDGGA